MGGEDTGHAVKRGDEKSTDATNIELASVAVYFRTLGGAVGDSARGIAGVPFKIRIDGKDYPTRTNVTDADGRVVVPTPAGKKVELEIFSTVYRVTRTALAKLETVRGVKERLARLGYDPGAFNDDYPSVQFDAAVCAFQTDAKVDRLGLILADDLNPDERRRGPDGVPRPVVTRAGDMVSAATLQKLDAEATKK